ncbi:MAG: carbohydrate kinase [Planctomycetes bacterium]|nr:carbohydrate kinase [Planctomycetota bacterium]
MTTAASLLQTLAARRGELAGLSAVAGFDGFVDEMISVVGERSGPERWSPMRSMAELGAVISGAAGRNGLREIVVRGTDAGGCAVNLGDALCALGVGLDYYGTIGQPRHPAFDAFAARCRSCTALGRSYGRTLALEFGDGKFFLSAVDQLGELSPALLDQATADGAYEAACRRAGLIVLNNWTLYPHMTACWRWLQEHVYARLDHRPWLFVDLVDPSGRAVEDVRAMLAALSVFQRTCETVFGLNLTEAAVIAGALGLPSPDRTAAGIAATAEAIRARLGVAQVVVHNIHFNAVAEAGGTIHVPAGPHCAKPRKSTGAGDRFNAGYCLGLLLGLDAVQRCDLGSAVSGFFVREARSPGVDELGGFLQRWADGGLADSSLG